MNNKAPTLEFIEGQQDCREGKLHEEGKSEDYNRGYRCEYELEQIKAEVTSNAR